MLVLRCMLVMLRLSSLLVQQKLLHRLLILLSLLNDLCSFLPLFLDDFLSLLDFLLLFGDPHLEISSLSFISSGSQLLLLEHLWEHLLLSLFSEFDGVLSKLDELGVVVQVEILNVVGTLEVSEGIAIEDWTISITSISLRFFLFMSLDAWLLLSLEFSKIQRWDY